MPSGSGAAGQLARRAASRAGLRPLAAVYALSAAGCCAVAASAHAALVDLHVYRLGGDVVLHGGDLYGVRWARLPFTYPPFAAVAFAPVAGLPWPLAAALLLVASAIALPATFYLALRLAPFPSWLQRADAARLALAVAAAAIWLEPVRSTLSYGQINLLLSVAIVADLALPDSARFKGAAIGVAAGVKLTPAIFVLYLLVTRRYRAAGVAAATFAATIAIGYAVLPAGSARYWDLTFLRSQRVSPVQNDTNQSLLGAIARDIGRVPGPAWLLVVAAVAVAGLWLAARAHRRGDEAIGFGLCAITGLLVSPISWTHHWVIALPALLVAAVSGWRLRATRPRATAARLAGIAVLAVIGWLSLVRRVPGSPASWLHLGWLWLVVSQLYVLAAIVVLGMAASPVVRSRPDGAAASRAPGTPGTRQGQVRNETGMRE
jgi:alpha-1,2-mannosyltransferase